MGEWVGTHECNTGVVPRARLPLRTIASPHDHPMRRWRAIALVVVVACAALVRLWLIQHFPEPDADAKGHLGIAN